MGSKGGHCLYANLEDEEAATEAGSGVAAWGVAIGVADS